MDDKLTKKLSWRSTEELHAWLREKSLKDFRTIQSMINLILTDAMEKDKKKRK